MNVAFFEDFSQDVGDSIAQRYEGSAGRYVVGTDIGGWPLISTTADSAFAPGVSTGTRREIYLEFEDNGYTGTRHGTNPFYAFGMVLYPRGTLLYVSSTINAQAQDAINLAQYPVQGTLNIKSIYMDIDFNSRIYSVFINGYPCIVLKPIPSWWIDFLPNTEALVVPANSGSLNISNFVKNAIFVADNPLGTRLNVDTIQITERPLTYVSSTDMQYSALGYVQDTDKDTPLELVPNVYTDNKGQVEYSGTTPVDTLASQVYTAGWSENVGLALTVGSSVLDLTKNPTGNRVARLTGDSVVVAVQE